MGLPRRACRYVQEKGGIVLKETAKGAWVTSYKILPVIYASSWVYDWKVPQHLTSYSFLTGVCFPNNRCVLNQAPLDEPVEYALTKTYSFLFYGVVMCGAAWGFASGVKKAFSVEHKPVPVGIHVVPSEEKEGKEEKNTSHSSRLFASKKPLFSYARRLINIGISPYNGVEEYLCDPISKKIINNPVRIKGKGSVVYDRDSLLKWFKNPINKVIPHTGEAVSRIELVEDKVMQCKLEQYVSMREWLYEQDMKVPAALPLKRSKSI